MMRKLLFALAVILATVASAIAYALFVYLLVK